MKPRMLIGVITGDCHNECQREILCGIISQAFKSSCDTAVISSTHAFQFSSPHKNTEKNIFRLILSEEFDGFLYDRNSFYSDDIKRYIEELCIRSGKPIMLMDCNEHKLFDTTMTDDISCFELITDHLVVRHGCKIIYCLTGPKGTPCAEGRLKGYLRSMKKHGLSIDKSWIFYGDFWHDSAERLAYDIISGKIAKPDAIACGNDVMAVTLIENLIKGGIKVPEDIAVTGYDAASDGYRSHPSVTSCKRPNFQLGAESFRRLYRIITGKICSKIQDETAELRLGRSCGCTENSDFKSDFLRRLKISENFSQQLIYGDMLTDITAPDRLEECINRIDNYTYLIYKMSRIIFCVTEKYKNSIHHFGEISLDYSEKEPIEIIFDKSAISRNNQTGTFKTSGEALKFICSSRSQPSAFYISPLHYNNNFFGFAALSFGKQPISYDRIYLQWLNYANMALEKVLIQSAMNNYLQKTDALASYDSLTGLLNRNGFITAFNEKVNSVPPGTSVSYIHIEISELKKLYYNNGYSKTSEIIKNFADILKFYSGADKICGTIAPGCCGLACFGDENPDDIFAAFKKSVQESPLFHGRGTVSFNAGICTVASSEHIDIWEMIYNASINSVHSFAKRERNTNPQFEKLCGLRSRMIKNPELMWNISEIAGSMFISKSYLQKIYKAYFGKSIIEELIEFRLDKAKKLLLETEMTVSDIALECGYSTYNYFVRQFRTSENISPSEYRNIHSNGGERT